MSKAVMVVLALASAACGHHQSGAQNSVTVRLPPPRPADAAPGFVFERRR